MLEYSLSCDVTQLNELDEHLRMNGYHFIIDRNFKMISIDSEEASYLKTILDDRGISYVEV